MRAAAGKPRRPSRRKPDRGTKNRRGRSSGRLPASKRETEKRPADIPACAKRLGLWAVTLGPDGWFVLASVARSSGSHFVWRQANDAERILLEKVAGDRFVAGHWSIRPGGPRGASRRKPSLVPVEEAAVVKLGT